ncbi:unnamed protein product [Paramecium octaurelia]|uniref:Uncharacterized protein n=1 Tax=Paramecium octaurelia TaxID=43137 RepID=A0A8S1YHM3_PAROT|nr:unnamed protein product [Paramecium octaurelia]
MKRSNQLISGNENGSTLIWLMNHHNYWFGSQTIKQHYDRINFLIMNDNVDIFISNSDDKTIRFSTKQQELICQQTITDHKD